MDDRHPELTPLPDGGSSLAPGDVLARKYRLRRLLGQGGMATVWVAENIALNTEVAVKVMRSSLAGDPRLVARARQEARATAAIAHKNIVQVFDFGITGDGSPFLVMELLHGETLGERLRKRGKLPPAEAVAIALRAMKGITVAHSKGVIHRDLKPENIFLAIEDNGTERPKVLDFGVSFMVQDDSTGGGKFGVTYVGALVGTPAYLPPEVISGEKRADARADIWALGVMLYEMIAGRPPFDAKNYHEILHAVVEQAPTPLRQVVPTVDPVLEHIILRALAKRPEDRFPSVRTFFDALLVWLGENDPGQVYSRHEVDLDDEGPTYVAGSALAPPPTSDRDDDDVPTRVATQAQLASTSRVRTTSPAAPMIVRASAARLPLAPPGPPVSMHAPAPPRVPREVAGTHRPSRAVVLVLALGLASVGAFLAVGRAWREHALFGRDEVTIDVLGVPAGAFVSLNGAPSVLPLHVARGSTAHVRIEAEGYLPWQEEVTAEGSVRLTYSGVERSGAPVSSAPRRAP